MIERPTRTLFSVDDVGLLGGNRGLVAESVRLGVGGGVVLSAEDGGVVYAVAGRGGSRRADDVVALGIVGRRVARLLVGAVGEDLSKVHTSQRLTMSRCKAMYAILIGRRNRIARGPIEEGRARAAGHSQRDVPA